MKTVQQEPEDFVDAVDLAPQEDFVDEIEVSEGDSLAAELKYEAGQLAYFWSQQGRDSQGRPSSFNKHLARVEKVEKGKVTLQPLPPVNGPLPTTVKRLAQDILLCTDPFNPERVEARITMARCESEKRAAQVKMVFSKFEKKPKDPVKEKVRKLEMSPRWNWTEIPTMAFVKEMKAGWAQTILLAIHKHGTEMTAVEVEEAVKDSEVAKASKMTPKVAVAWYLNDLTKKKMLERC